MLTAITV